MHVSDNLPNEKFTVERSAHKQRLDHHMINLVIAMYNEHGVGTKLQYPKDFPHLNDRYARGFTTNYAYLRHWGLLERTGNGKTPDWHVTELGEQFIRGEIDAPAWVYNVEDKLVGRSATRVKVSDFEVHEVTRETQSTNLATPSVCS